jgi:hypothetical protein
VQEIWFVRQARSRPGAGSTEESGNRVEQRRAAAENTTNDARKKLSQHLLHLSLTAPHPREYMEAISSADVPVAMASGEERRCEHEARSGK